MPIPVTCSQCGRSFSVADRYAGQDGLCPHCNGVIQVPNTPTTAIDRFDFPEERGSERNPPPEHDFRSRRRSDDSDFDPFYANQNRNDDDSAVRSSRKVEPWIRDWPQWERFRSALGKLQLANALGVAALSLNILVTLISGNPGAFNNDHTTAEIVFSFLVLILVFAASVTLIIGRVGCVRAPAMRVSETARSSLIIWIISLIALAIGVGAALLAGAAAAGGNIQAVEPLMMLVGCSGIVVFILGSIGEMLHGSMLSKVGTALRLPEVQSWGKFLSGLMVLVGVGMMFSCIGFIGWLGANAPQGGGPPPPQLQKDAEKMGEIFAFVMLGIYVLYMALNVAALNKTRAMFNALEEQLPNRNINEESAYD